MLNGIDVSAYQSSTLDMSGQDFVVVKATEGLSYVNPKQSAQAAYARAAGAVVGFYHFARPGDIQAQAEYFVQQCASADGDILAIDWEDTGVSCADKDALLKAVKKLRPTHKVVLYCSRSFWLDIDTTSYCEDGLWIADYSHPAGQPAIQHPWLFHQYSQDGVDRDVANFASAVDLRSWATGKQADPSSVPQWRTLLDHVQSIPEKIYETWTSTDGWDNRTKFGVEYGEDGVSWCVIFEWDMYHDCGLDAIVPKVDNVDAFTAWAKERGQWSYYPSVGAWVNFNDGAHTEIVVGFDDTYVYTKGGNSIEAGAVDNGQGNGVWSHRHERQDAVVVGYFAPRFLDGVCPPTADPRDPRGGTAVRAYTWPGPATAPTPPSTPSTPAPSPKPSVKTVSLARLTAAREKDLPARTGHKTHPADVLVIEEALHAEGLLAKEWVDGSWGTETDKAYHLFRLKMGFRGKEATGDPGLASLKLLAKRHKFKATK
ncbi:GH25 family lysozyme [Streptomyces sp. NPDC058299]|uniref:GH25 family lysozyme n=1 Tax=Streptomyces sp. NPDC058299 TaxID=3346435 RepID=UPI0036EE6EF6